MLKEYELSAIEKETDAKPLFKDTFGNYWVNAVFVGIGEPVKIVTPDLDKWTVGEKYFGEIETKTSKAGKPYLKFKRAKPEDLPQTPERQAQEDKRGDAITASMTVKLAFQAFISAESMLPQAPEHWRKISQMASKLYETINTVKNTEIPENPLRDAIELSEGEIPQDELNNIFPPEDV